MQYAAAQCERLIEVPAEVSHNAIWGSYHRDPAGLLLGMAVFDIYPVMANAQA